MRHQYLGRTGLVGVVSLLLLSACGTLQAHRDQGLGLTAPSAGTVRAVNNLERAADAKHNSGELVLRSVDIGICVVAELVFLPIDSIANQMRAGHFVFHYGR